MAEKQRKPRKNNQVTIGADANVGQVGVGENIVQIQNLNLGGARREDAPALSAIPKSERPLHNLPLVGRESDLKWLRETPGDKVLVGQPGTGKTFLLEQLTKEDTALFVNEANRGLIADGIRSQEPRILIVDDAQLSHELLTTLKQLREELRAEFTIVASGWRGDMQMLAEALNLPSTQVRELERLTRPKIVQVINAMGIYGPVQLVFELVEQSEGLPGLAVTLADLCLKGDVRSVALGDAVRTSLLKYFSGTLGVRSTIIVGAFAVGGEGGMYKRVIAQELGLSVIELQEILVRLYFGGVLEDLGDDRLRVRPRALREALVRDVFFVYPSPPDINAFVRQAPSLKHSVLTIIGASRRGAVIPRAFLQNLVEEVNLPDVWRHYTGLGLEQTMWVLATHPEQVITVAQPALYYAPEDTLPHLLKAAINDTRDLGANPDQPLRLIADWLKSGEPGAEQSITRRKAVIRAAKAWLGRGLDVKVGNHAMTLGFSPRFEGNITDPGDENTITMRYGVLGLEDLKQIASMWTDAFASLKDITIDDWQSLRELVREWAYAEVHGIALPEETSSFMRTFASQMLTDLSLLANNRPEVVHWQKEIANHLGTEGDLSLEPDFETLYPYRESGDWKADLEKQSALVAELAKEWSKLEPEQVANRICEIETIAQRGSLHWPRYTPLLCQEIAAQAESPNQWARVMIAAGNSSELILPFLDQAATKNEAGWMETARECLDQPRTRLAGVVAILKAPSLPADYLEAALTNLEGFAENLKGMAIRNEIPEATVIRLLTHSDESIASAAAWGEWFREPSGAVRESVREEWERAILQASDESHLLEDVFHKQPDLGRRWFQLWLANGARHSYYDTSLIGAAIFHLDIDTRRAVLETLPAEYRLIDIAVALVGTDLDLYQELLGNERLQIFHLAPLGQQLDGVWISKAKLALRAGYSAEDLAHAAYIVRGGLAWHGAESKMRAEWVARFDQLSKHEDEDIRKIGELGKADAEQELNRALARERREAIFGEE